MVSKRLISGERHQTGFLPIPEPDIAHGLDAVQVPVVLELFFAAFRQRGNLQGFLFLTDERTYPPSARNSANLVVQVRRGLIAI